MNQAELDQRIARLVDKKTEWARLPIAQKRALLEALRGKTAAVAEQWVNAAIKAKGIEHLPLVAGEEWIAGPWALLHGINGLIETLTWLEKGETRPLRQVRKRANGQVVVDMFPLTGFDRLLLSGFRSEVWMQPEVTTSNLAETVAVFYKEKDPVGKVSLVLGAGNVSSIAPLDVLYKLFAEGQVCLLKMNPVNDYLGAIFEKIFSTFEAAGYLQFAYGGADVGAYISSHPQIDEIHMTGSARTHDAIVYGVGAEGTERKKRDEPINTKRVSSELGNASPTIIVPGPWTDDDLRYQAEHLATQKFQNAGFNCVASQVLVLPTEWDKTPALLDELRKVIKSIPPRPAYYPGAEQRQKDAVAAHPNAEILDTPAPNIVPRTLVSGLDPQAVGEYCFTEEFFGGVYAQTSLPGKTAAEFLKNAVQWSNDTLLGTLGANLIIHPTTMRELGGALDQAISDLRYGTIAINAWTAVGYLLSMNTWGAYPGHARNDIQSGTGVVHNTFLFDKPQKSVVYQPFYPFPRNLRHSEFHLSPKPAWFLTNKKADVLGKRLVAYEANRSLLHMPGIFAAALQG